VRPDGAFAYAFNGQTKDVTVVDGASGRSVPDLRGRHFSPDRSLAVALARRAVVVLDGATGRELARLGDVGSPDAVVFDARTAAAPVATAGVLGGAALPPRP